MKQSEKIIAEFFKPYFDKYPELNSLFFLIYHDSDGNNVYFAEEDCGINDLRWDELSDDNLYESSYKIQEAIKLLEKTNVDVQTIIGDLQKLVTKLQLDADGSNPLNKTLEETWNDKTRKALNKKVAKYLRKEIPWKYVDWCQCTVNRDGSVEIEEFQRK
jgi:hypothetical protein